MPVITLPDGAKRQYDQPITAYDVAADIGPGLAKAALAARLDGELIDLSRVIEDDATLAMVTAKDDDALALI
ncbi:MAG: TGS domain-containing protein, partial [Candidatus Puniceispirillales bacterium]